MAEQHAVLEEQSEKKQGDKLDQAVESVLNKGAGLTQDTSNKGTQPTPQNEPLK